MGDISDTDQIDGMGVASDPLFALPRYQKALTQFVQAYDNAAGLSILTGAEGSGRRRLLRCLAARLQPHVASAFVSAAEPRETILLSSVFGQFGYDFSSQILNELTGMLRVFSIHQADLGYRPVIGVLDAEKCSASLAEILQEALAIRTARKPAMHIVLAGTRSLRERLACDDMVELNLNTVADVDLGEFNEGELCCYLDARYGLTDVSAERISQLQSETGGCVERIDALLQREEHGTNNATDALMGVETVDSSIGASEVPTLLLSQTGTLLDTIPMQKQRFLIGRAEHNDIVLDSRYISRHHALIVAGPSDAHWLIDLNSRNGTFVNSRAVDYVALRHNDIVILGNHRLKYHNPEAQGPRPDRSEFAGSATAVFQTLSADGVQAPQLDETR
ncbi:MAG: FHA domain-containing protein, partial [Pseudomonadota bacterium]